MSFSVLTATVASYFDIHRSSAESETEYYVESINHAFLMLPIFKASNSSIPLINSS